MLGEGVASADSVGDGPSLASAVAVGEGDGAGVVVDSSDGLASAVVAHAARTSDRMIGSAQKDLVIGLTGGGRLAAPKCRTASGAS
jgi:hypothetical protein